MKWIRRTGWFILGIFILAFILRLSLKTNFVRSWAKNMVVSTANNQLNGKLEIDQLKGDLWEEITISGIRLAQRDTIARIDSVHLAYNIWALLGGHAEVSQLGIYRPSATLRQSKGKWNVQDLVAPSEDTTSTGTTLSFTIENFALNDGSIAVHADSLPVESDFELNKLNIASSLSYEDENFALNLQNLSFQVDSTKLDKSLQVQTVASAQNKTVTLEKLVLATGNSLIKTSAKVSQPDSAIQVEVSGAPISWKDITSYVREFPLRRNLQIDLTLKGNPQNFGLTVTAEGDGLESFKIGGQFQWHSSLILQQLTLNAGYLNPATLLADSSLPSLHNLSTEFTGAVDLQNYRHGHGDLQFSAEQISKPPFHVDALSATVQWEGEQARGNMNARQQEQRLSSKISVAQLWSDLPAVRVHVEGAHIDPGYWAQDTTYSGDLTFSGQASGPGWYPDKKPWDYSLQMSGSRLMGQPIAHFTAKGKASGVNSNVDAHLKIRNGIVTLAANLRDAQSHPSYQFKLTTEDFDPVVLTGKKDLKSAFNASVSGNGQGFDPASMQLQSSVRIDSSTINGEFIRNFSAGISVQDSVARVDSARLQSTMAEGTFNLRMNMLRRYDPDNELSLELKLRDISALAPLVNIDTLEAEGKIAGKISPDKNGKLQFNGDLDLSDIRYNSVFTAVKVKGSVEARAHENLEYMADVNITSPTFSGFEIQDMHFMTKGAYTERRTRAMGGFEFEFSSPNEGRIEQAGQYDLKADSISVTTSKFNIVSDFRTLRLQHPFQLAVRHDTLQMDTMRVASADQDAFFEIGIPQFSSNEQRGFINGKSLNTAVIQNCLIGKTLFEGMLSGQFEIVRRDTSLQAQGELLLSDIDYEGAQFDSLLIKGYVRDDRMKGQLSVVDEGKQLVKGDADLPFKLGNPETFPPAFFEEPVRGHLTLRRVSIEHFHSLIEEAGITETSGILSFSGQLDGQAGMPQFNAKATLNNAKLSGVEVDSVTAGLNYSHEQSELRLNASILSLRQKAVQIQGQIPLFINMKTFRVDLPEAEDRITLDIESHDFNLSALNDFVDRKMIRDISGKLNGTIHVMGAVNDLKTKGELELRRGAFRLVPAGIRVDNIRSDINFMPTQIKLTNFSARSGKGNLNASGVMAMKKLVPGDVDIEVSADNFRVANTAKYNAVINMDTKATGTFTKPKVSGDVEFISGFVELQNFGEKSVENVQLDSTDEAVPQVSVYDSLSLDLDVSFNRRFFIRNKRYLEMEIELDGSLDMMKGPGKNLQLFGTMNAARGYARPFGKEFSLEEGTITFSGDPKNPQLMIRTRYEPPQTEQKIVIWYVIEGTVENPKFRYESQPPMELENIISYTLFGQPFYALNSWKQVVASSGQNTTAADVALDVLLDRVEMLATQKLGIDVVKIDNTTPSGENGTSITTGWYLNPRVFFAIQNVITGSTPDTSFELEYLLRRNLKLILRQGNGFRQGVDVKWNYDY